MVRGCVVVAARKTSQRLAVHTYGCWAPRVVGVARMRFVRTHALGTSDNALGLLWFDRDF